MTGDSPDAPTQPPEGHEAIPLSGDAPNPAVNEVSTVSATPAARQRMQIGAYRLIQKAGEGGMGEVWLAEQTEPIRRKVALKIIKLGMDTKHVIARFEQERQALAVMNHPNVAKVFDAGVTPEGRPYFVMEYVQGLPITEHCDRHKLPTVERLALFSQVCEGVQHAHHKAIIHRDLKPSNVLVTIQEDRPVPKIIDFGVAKATAQRLIETSLFTEHGVLIGTPEYMSPEQADMTAQDVDTRTDVYSLGVMLYELLVGALPFEPAELRRAGLDGIRRMIREVEPPKPSTRLSILGPDRSTDSARLRRADVHSLHREVSGDLDWIAMKALEKDRTRRYGSPADLAADLGRHLRNEPVLARPPSSIYRAAKFIRRNRFGVAVAGVAAIALVAVAVVMGIQAQRIAREAEAKEQVSEFLKDLFHLATPDQSLGKNVTARELLDHGVVRIRKDPNLDSEVKLDLLITLGEVYRTLGMYSTAEPLLQEAFTGYQHSFPGDPKTHKAATELGRLLRKLERYGEAEELMRATVAQMARTVGLDHPDTLYARHTLADILLDRGRFAEASALAENVSKSCERLLGAEDDLSLRSRYTFAVAYFKQGHLDEGTAMVQELLERSKRVYGRSHPMTVNLTAGLGSFYRAQGRFREAEEQAREAVESSRRVSGFEHYETLTYMVSLAYDCINLGKCREAEALDKDALDISKRTLGNEHSVTLDAMKGLASAYSCQERYQDAEALIREALETSKRVLGSKHPLTLAILDDYAADLLSLGKYEESSSVTEEVISGRKDLLGLEHPDTLFSFYRLAVIRLKQGRLAEAESLGRLNIEARRRVLGADHPNTLWSMNATALTLAAQRQLDEAEALHREILQIRVRTLGASHPDTLLEVYNLGCVAALRGDHKGAIEYLREAVDKGFARSALMEDDSDLAKLRDDAHFKSILEQARKNQRLARGGTPEEP